MADKNVYHTYDSATATAVLEKFVDQLDGTYAKAYSGGVGNGGADKVIKLEIDPTQAGFAVRLADQADGTYAVVLATG